MKSGMGFFLMWIQCTVLSVFAVVEAELAGWSALAAVGAWMAGMIIGMFPIIRSLALFGLLLIRLPWWQAAGIVILVAPLLCLIETIGKKMMMSPLPSPQSPPA
jgi:hypothetical protein